MFYVYVIKSLKDQSLYIGYTDNLEKRIKKHNDGLVSYTSKHIPYKIIYFETYLSEKDARRRERNLKNKGGQRDFLKENIQESLEI